MKYLQKYLSACLLGLAALVVGAAPAWAQVVPPLGAASTFAALGNAGVTCDTAPAHPVPTVTGDVGTGPGALSVTGFPNLCTLSGDIVLDTPAFADFHTAYTTIDTANPCPPVRDAVHNLSGDLSGMTLSPGVYCISGVGLLSGNSGPLTLDARGKSKAVWIFKGGSITPIGSAALRSTVRMVNGGQSCNVYWRLATAATFSLTDFVGNVLAGSTVTFTGSSLAGRAMADRESVTMTDGSSITACTGGVTPPPSCDKNHKHHKHCKHDKHHKHHKPHCDGEHDGHDKDGHDSHDNDNDNDGDDNDNDDRGRDDHPWR